MTESDDPLDPASSQPPAAQAGEDDVKKAEAERPAHRRSVFFDHEPRIRELLAAGRSYRQILCILRLKNMHRSVLARWCDRQGLHSQCPTRPGSKGAEKQAAPSTVPAAPPAPVSSGPVPNGARLADAYGPEAADPLAGLRPSTPRSNP